MNINAANLHREINGFARYIFALKNCVENAHFHFPLAVGGIVKTLQGLISRKYAVIRRDDMSVVAEMDYFPDSERAIWLREGKNLNIRGLKPDERVISPPVLRDMVHQFMGQT